MADDKLKILYLMKMLLDETDRIIRRMQLKSLKNEQALQLYHLQP